MSATRGAPTPRNLGETEVEVKLQIATLDPVGRETGGVNVSRQAQRSEATRRKLMDAAIELFAERGFAGTATEDIVDRAGVTRGALYHQFTDKADLFRAVVEELEAEVMRRVVRSLTKVEDPWDQLISGCEAVLDAALDPAIQRIVILDAPSVLDWEEWRALEERYGLGLVRTGLENVMNAGIVRSGPVEPMAQMLLAALTQSACMIGRASQKRKARAEVGVALHAWLEGLRAERPAASSMRRKSPVSSAKSRAASA